MSVQDLESECEQNEAVHGNRQLLLGCACVYVRLRGEGAFGSSGIALAGTMEPGACILVTCGVRL